MTVLDFRGKGLVYSHHLTLPFLSLVADAKKSVNPIAEDENLVVEGNGLLALKALIPRFGGRFDLIYAMPPYNNGVDGWKYDDDIPTPLTQEWLRSTSTSGIQDADRHDKWLSWMLPRLRLMHELVADTGVVCISIDDNEMHRLKCLMDEIFQEDNFLATLIWQKRYAPPPDVKDIGFVTECILVYRKSARFHPRLLPLTDEQIARYENRDDDPRGPWKAMDYTCRYTRQERPNLYYAIENPHTHKKIKPKETRVWAYSKKEHERNVRENRIWWGKKGANTVPALKNFADEIQQGMVPTSLLLHEDVGHTDEAAKELRELLPDVKRDAKPTRLIRHLLRMSCDAQARILFPFGGTGEGPQAVLEANVHDKIDGKTPSRKFVAVAQADAYPIVARRLRQLINNGLSGSFEFCRLGPSVDTEALLAGNSLPDYVALARHVYRTATGRSLTSVDKPDDTWLIGEAGEIDLHLVYRPDREFLMSDEAMLGEQLARRIADTRGPRRRSIVFASGKYLPLRELAALSIEFCPFPLSVYRLSGS
jgi:adenine-specific DNA-methyltransferase